MVPGERLAMQRPSAPVSVVGHAVNHVGPMPVLYSSFLAHASSLFVLVPLFESTLHTSTPYHHKRAAVRTWVNVIAPVAFEIETLPAKSNSIENGGVFTLGTLKKFVRVLGAFDTLVGVGTFFHREKAPATRTVAVVGQVVFAGSAIPRAAVNALVFMVRQRVSISPFGKLAKSAVGNIA
ncbi:MAG: hypothetical protein P4L84_10010 [Isosphaeraceae bacterium]|nr:hypothetical protein [Isosphaeraceae bacterium]